MNRLKATRKKRLTKNSVNVPVTYPHSEQKKTRARSLLVGAHPDKSKTQAKVVAAGNSQLRYREMWGQAHKEFGDDANDRTHYR